LTPRYTFAMEADDDLKGMLREFMDESRREHAVTRAHVDAKTEETQRHVDARWDETQRHFDSKAEETQRHFDLKAEETKRHFDAKAEETKRHFDATIEALKDRFDLLAEGLLNLDEKIGREVGDVRTEMRSGFATTESLIRYSYAELEKRCS
jgi:hypothetical protein